MHRHNDHPDPYVTQCAAVMLVSAMETRNLRLIGNAVTLSSALACHGELVGHLAFHGAARLTTLGADHVDLGPWELSRLVVNEEPTWTFTIAEEYVRDLFAQGEAMGYECADPDETLRELRRAGASVVTAANGLEVQRETCEEHQQQVLDDTADSVLAHWPEDEGMKGAWGGIVRLATFVAELSHVAHGCEDELADDDSEG